ncbi:hypothetical protein DUI87_12983 [Hirundo rustica rustica]|uniref:Cadherin-like beta-sandwich-like domain-containing protein n=1 Tax=Hirundo rustica rustica TaxID=333673 RepID=A0A3M0KAF4_HIRRU|nr:hypothetical protein DUI87_12983 [Hirundo rustica rustica]
MQASSKMDLLLAKAESINSGGSTSGITCLRREIKQLHNLERLVKKEWVEVLQAPEQKFSCSLWCSPWCDGCASVPWRSPDVCVNLSVPFTTKPGGCSLAMLQEFLICPNVLLAIGKPFTQPHVVTLKSAILYCVSHVTLQNSEPKANLQLPLVTPDCSGQPGLSRASTARNVSQGSTATERAHGSHLQHWWKQSMSTKLNQVSTTSDHNDDLKAQDLSVIIKAYVLVTSLTPLRAFIHSTTTVWHPPKKKHFTIKEARLFRIELEGDLRKITTVWFYTLSHGNPQMTIQLVDQGYGFVGQVKWDSPWHSVLRKEKAFTLSVLLPIEEDTCILQRFFEIFFRNSSPQQAFNNMKEAINKLLLMTEVFSKSSASGPNSFNQCSQCFQMLTFDIGFSMSIHPVVLKVHEYFDFQVENVLTIQDQISKELIFEDTFKFLLSNESSTSSFIEALQKIYGSSDGTYNREDEQCFSLEEINSVITFIKELKSLGQFELLFPSSAPKMQMLLRDLYRRVDPMRRLSSVLTVHWLLSSVLQQFQFTNKEAHTNLSEWQLSPENMSPKQNFPSDFKKNPENKDTLSHIRQIFTSPQLDLNPEFNPKIRKYYAEVPFDVVTVKIGAEPSNCQCHVHLDDKKGPSIANYPLGLGLNKVIILLTDDSQPSPEVVSSYKITIYREDRPSLPLFDDYMMCGFVQDIVYAVKRLLSFAVVIVAAADPLGSSEFECLARKDMESASLELQSNYISNQTVSYLQS